MTLHFLSFCDEHRPEGDRFLGGAVVEASSFVAAVITAHQIGCNPGGECLGAEIPPYLFVPASYRDRLLTRDEVVDLDAIIVATPSGAALS